MVVPNQEKGSKFGSCIEISNPQDLPTGPMPTEKTARKVAHSRFWVTQVLQCWPPALFSKNAIEGALRVQSRASERLQDQIIEEIEEMEHTKTEEALQFVRKEHDLWRHQNFFQKKKEAKKLQGARNPRKDEEMAWAPPRNMSKWPDWE